jgi:hypothetical protein
MPNIGLVKFLDAETKQEVWVDTAVASVRQAYANDWLKNQNYIEQLFTRTGVKQISVRTDEDYVRPLMQLFKKQ